MGAVPWCHAFADLAAVGLCRALIGVVRRAADWALRALGPMGALLRTGLLMALVVKGLDFKYLDVNELVMAEMDLDWNECERMCLGMAVLVIGCSGVYLGLPPALPWPARLVGCLIRSFGSHQQQWACSPASVAGCGQEMAKSGRWSS